MFEKSSLWSAALAVSLGAGSAMSVSAENAIIPTLASADFGSPCSREGPTDTFDPAYPQRPGNQRGVMERMSDAENPNLKPWAQELMRKYNQDVLNGHRAFTSQARCGRPQQVPCWPGGE